MVMEINREDERPDIVMTVKDKDDINRFSRHLARKNELNLKIKSRKKLIQLHEDASDELILMDDDAPVHHAVGDVFMMDDKEQIEAALEATKTELSIDVETYENEVKTIIEDMAKLKATLYAKFGKVRSFVSLLLFRFRLFSMALPNFVLDCFISRSVLLNRQSIWRNSVEHCRLYEILYPLLGG